MLVSGLFDVMFVTFVNVKLLNSFNNEKSAMVSLGEPACTFEGDIYDALFETKIPLIALIEAGPHILESLGISVAAQKNYRLVSDKYFLEHAASAVGKGAFTLSEDEVARIKAVVVEESTYDSILFESMIALAEMASEFCLECEFLFESSSSSDVDTMPLIFSYFEKARTCANRNYAGLFP